MQRHIMQSSRILGADFDTQRLTALNIPKSLGNIKMPKLPTKPHRISSTPFLSKF